MFIKGYKPSNAMIILGLHFICSNLGQIISIGFFKLSYISSILLVLYYLSVNDYRIKIPQDRNMRFFIRAMLVWSLYALVQIVVIKDIHLFFQFYFILITNVFTVAFSLLIIKDRNDLIFGIDMLSLSFILNIIAACYEYISGSVIIDTGNVYTRIKVGGFIGNFNDFCIFLFFAIIVFLLEIMINRSFVLRLMYMGAIGLAVYFIFWNGSRGGIYSLYLLGVTWPLLFLLCKVIKCEKNYNHTILLLLVVFSIALVVFISVFGFYNALALLDRSGGGDIGSDRGRVGLIINAMMAMIEYLGFGIGAGQSILTNLVQINVHNFYAEIFSEYGVIIGLFATYVSTFVFIKRNGRLNITIDSLLQASGYCFLIANVTSSSVNKMRAFWIYITLVYIIKKTGYFNNLSLRDIQSERKSFWEIRR